MTTAVIILGSIVLILLIMVIVLFVKLSTANRKLDELLKRSASAEIDVYQDHIDVLNSRLAEQQVALNEKIAAYEESIKKLAEFSAKYTDTNKLVDEFNKLLGG